MVPAQFRQSCTVCLKSAFRVEKTCVIATASLAFQQPVPRSVTTQGDEHTGPPETHVPTTKLPSCPPRPAPLLRSHPWLLHPALRPLHCCRCLLAASVAFFPARLDFFAAVRATFAPSSTDGGEETACFKPLRAMMDSRAHSSLVLFEVSRPVTVWPLPRRLSSVQQPRLSLM